MINDKLLLSEFAKIIRRKADVIDLDNTFTHKFDFIVQPFEEILKNTGPSIPPNRWSYYRIGLLKTGSGEFITGIHKFKAQKNTLIVIPSRIITSSKNWTPDTTGYFVLFNIDFFLQNNFSHKYIEGKRILHSSICPYVHLTDKQAAEIGVIFEKILKEKASTHKHKDELIALKIIELIIACERLFSAEHFLEDNAPATDIIKRFVDLVEVNFLHERSVAFYATQLNVHPNHLNLLVKKHTHLTAKESIQNRLFLEIKYLLHSTNLTIKEIAHQLGFTDPNYFTVFFKRCEKMSPMQYRSSFV